MVAGDVTGHAGASGGPPNLTPGTGAGPPYTTPGAVAHGVAALRDRVRSRFPASRPRRGF